jgi:hypothetical protein
VKDGDGEAVGRVPSEAGDEQAPEPHKSREHLEGVPTGEKPKGDSDSEKENLNHRPSTTNMACEKEKEKEKKKPIKPDQEPFEAWERDEMEKLLGELRGHLGEGFATFERPVCGCLAHAFRSHIPNTVLGRRGHCEQFPLQRRQAHAATDFQLILPPLLACRHSVKHGQLRIHPLNHLLGYPPFPLPHSCLMLARILEERKYRCTLQSHF